MLWTSERAGGPWKEEQLLTEASDTPRSRRIEQARLILVESLRRFGQVRRETARALNGAKKPQGGARTECPGLCKSDEVRDRR